MEKMVNVYIHGANSSPRSFEYLKLNLKEFDILDIDYDTDNPLEKNIEQIINKIKRKTKGQNVNVIGHSLGGLIAIKVGLEVGSVNKVVTMSSPFGGSKISDFFQWFYPSCQLFKDTSPNCKLIKEFKKSYITIPTLSIVTKKGNVPVFGEPNDGTITVSSQMSLSGPHYIQYDLNHFEVLLDHNVATSIKTFLQK